MPPTKVSRLIKNLPIRKRRAKTNVTKTKTSLQFDFYLLTVYRLFVSKKEYISNNTT